MKTFCGKSGDPFATTQNSLGRGGMAFPRRIFPLKNRSSSDRPMCQPNSSPLLTSLSHPFSRISLFLFLFLAIEHKPATDGGGKEVTRRQDGNHKNEMSFPLSLRGLQQQQEMPLQSISLFGEEYLKFGKFAAKSSQKFRFCFSF